MSNTARVSGGGISFAGLLTIVFIVLKLCHVINWSWIWVLCPLWAGFAMALLLLIGGILIAAFFSMVGRRKFR